MLNESNAHELAQIPKAVARVLRDQLQYPGRESGDWELGTDVIPDILYDLRDREVLLILAPIEGGEPVHLCGICGFVLDEPGQLCPRCAVVNEEMAKALSDGRRVAESVEDWLKGQRQEVRPHPLEAEVARFQGALVALEACPAVWWADKVL